MGNAASQIWPTFQ